MAGRRKSLRLQRAGVATGTDCDISWALSGRQSPSQSWDVKLKLKLELSPSEVRRHRGQGCFQVRER